MNPDQNTLAWTNSDQTRDQTDLFGNPVTAPDTTATSPPPTRVNDMDLVQTVLADLNDKKAALLHIDDTGRIHRCGDRDLVPVGADFAVVVTQLLDSRYLATRQRSCPGHGGQITLTRAGRDALHRWQALHRPSTWTTTV
jgi:hypothetical protein